MIRQATKNQLFYGIRVEENRMMVNLFQFANNTLSLCEAKIKKNHGYKKCVELISRLGLTTIKVK